MHLGDGAIYVTPDGRRFHARQKSDGSEWVLVELVPVGDPTSSETLFVFEDRVICLDLEQEGRITRDTGWTVQDLRLEAV